MFKNQMNLRSVFTAEQQDTLERFYNNGMTNQSKSCFQLILQCAQETKLDFSVVRTWVGNKRRKLSSVVDQNGGVAHGPVNHTLAGGGRGAVLVTEMATGRSVQWDAAVARVSSPVPSPTTSFSPVASLPESGPRAKAQPLRARAESPPQIRPQPTLHPDVPPLHAKASTLSSRVPLLLPTSGPPLHSQARKPLSSGDPTRMPHLWTKQGTPPSQPRAWPFSSGLPRPPLLGAAQPSPHRHAADTGFRVQQVCTLAPQWDGDSPRAALGSSHAGGRVADSVGCLSIAMETGDVEDEYAREEELARMGAQIRICPAVGGGSSSVGGSGEPSIVLHRVGPAEQGVAESPDSDIFGGRAYQTPSTSSYCPARPLLDPVSSLRSTETHGRSPVQSPQQVIPQRPSSFQASGNLSMPWITSNSRKRTLQDRTQFSDGEVRTMKRYWESGMTSLGSVCREKISAVSAELSVDSEIVKTWIGNRRRKYRLMGIEIPPPKGGPAVFSSQSDAASPRSVTSEGDAARGPEADEDSERVDEVSVCLSEGSAGDVHQSEEGEDGDGEMDGTTLEDSVVQLPKFFDKIEIINDEEDDYGDMTGSGIDNVQTLLEFKNEEVQFLEGELENQRQKYNRLQNFTKNLLNAIKNHDKERQQELLSSLPQEVEENREMSPERSEPSAIAIRSYCSVSDVMGKTEGSPAGDAAEAVAL
ncbi:hypothetical protein AAFF_G00311600 [Aldrovandia affinis]|uniref:Homeobox domain-containing protein n=1 Tax=Aldrovandia affinis TaxID=143900 RepID=A0AAD7SP47_9TELE|nr:hypothetical protein AAFF_G00311600 [Aldrovandia affinis]